MAKFNYLLKVNFFLGWVCIVKAHDELSLESLLIVLIQQCGFGMANVQIPEFKAYISFSVAICKIIK